MSLMPAADNLTLTPPALPKGGGSLPGMATTPGAIGPDGQATLTLPLPISAGRGYAPSLTLEYRSGAGNGAWGSGWQCALPTIRRSTSRGVPTYTNKDIFLAPNGDVLVPEQDAQGQIITTTTRTFGTQTLAHSYQVTRYLPRVEAGFYRIERWQADGVADFWLIHNPSGELLCLGKTAKARMAEPADPQTRIACWMAEESVSPTGEHIYYQYRSAADVGVTDAAGRDCQAMRLLSSVSYGNVTASGDLWIWQDDAAPAKQAWLFTLVLDYGARGTDSSLPPAFCEPTDTPWPVRQDAFSAYDAGFELRTHFLCRQILMFHHFKEALGEDATLVRRLLLTYDENPLLSRLVGAQLLAYEPDATHTLQSLPPLELDYTAFTPPTQAAAWQPLALPDQLGLPPYCVVDLYGEGVSGLLYQGSGAWYYRAAIRDTTPHAGPDAVAYGELARLPLLPALQAESAITLLDIDGDGRLEWLVTLAEGLAGYYRLQADATWSAFTPLANLPLEFLHPGVTVADLHGAGLPDLAMIGPRSVRLYINERAGFAAGSDVAHYGDSGLPVRGADRQELVVLTDLLGSGQAHLVSVRHDRVQCWPNLGNGRFGQALTLPIDPPIDHARFNPRQVYLADTDGSGTTDLLYADVDGIHLYLNQAGNTLAAPVTLPYPTGVAHDRLNPLQMIDLSGQGTVSLVLTQLAHGAGERPQLWRCDLSTAKPYLLKAVSNNCGTSTQLTYRSSAQEWLDEKHATPTARAGIPFPHLLLSHTEQYDAVTATALIQRYSYRRGFWDSVERELRGYGYVERLEYDDQTGPLAVMPLRTCRWYHTGRADDATDLYGAPYHDPAAFPVQDTRLTQWHGTADDGQDLVLSPDTATTWWLNRALKGTLLREEQYGMDGSEASAIPYRVSQWRAQVRLVQPGTPAVALPMDPGSVHYCYERVACDPHVTQSVPLHYDGYGQLLWSVTLVYPRRLDAQRDNPYTATALPADAWAATFDAQQTLLRLTERRVQVRNQADAQAWLLGVPLATRQNALIYPAAQSPATGLTLEALSAPDGLLGATQPRELLGQQRYHYQEDPALPKTLALRDHLETALLNRNDLKVLADVLTGSQRQQLLDDGGYHSMPALLPAAGANAEPLLWAGNTDYCTYLGADQFWRPHTQTAAELPDANGQLPVQTVTWDACHCCVLSSVDAYGNTTTAAIDYRVLAPWQVTDINGNLHEAQRDALGRIVATSRYGTELAADNASAVNVGFNPLRSDPAPVAQTVAEAVATALAINQGSSRQLQASCVAYAPFSFMGQISVTQLQPLVDDQSAAAALFQHLQDLRFITPQGHLLTRAWRWAQATDEVEGVPAGLRPLLLGLPRQPVHNAVLTADAYPNAPQRISVQISHSDGAGRPLQTATLQPDGPAFQRSATGDFVMQNSQPLEAPAAPRWAIHGRTHYGPRGETVRVYHPYFVNDWQPINASALSASGHTDTHYYDATGRNIRTLTASGWLRRRGYTPWFTVSEDENNTAAESACTENAHD
jgi:hypothetical protein